MVLISPLRWNSHRSHPQASVASQGFPLFCSFIRSLKALAGLIRAARPARRPHQAGTDLGLLRVKRDESKSPQKGSCQGNTEPPQCLTFICFHVFYSAPTGPIHQRLVGQGGCLCGNPSRHVWRQGCQLDLAFCSLRGHVEGIAATQKAPACVNSGGRRRCISGLCASLLI